MSDPWAQPIPDAENKEETKKQVKIMEEYLNGAIIEKRTTPQTSNCTYGPWKRDCYPDWLWGMYEYRVGVIRCKSCLNCDNSVEGYTEMSICHECVK